MKPTLLLVGLGNPGKSYAQTRHNVGFRAVDLLAKHYATGDWSDKSKFSAEVCEGRIVTIPCLFVKPKTYMNCSGEAIHKLIDFYKIDPANQLLVFCDDIDIDLGTVRLKESGGPGTHNGLKSVVEHLGETFARLRIGIGPKPEGEDLATWVLSKPPKEQEDTIQKILENIPDMVKEYIMK